MQPSFEFYDRRESLIIKCNGSSKTNNVGMLFSYHEKNYTVPRINNRTGVYIGNFSVVSDAQRRVSIMCVDINNWELISVKIYNFGYPPSYISQFHKVDLSCRDYNLHRIVCCITPNLTMIRDLLGFDELKRAKFAVKLIFTDSISEIIVNTTCFELTDFVPAPTFSLDVVIENVLGNKTYNFNFNRLDIQKPEEPQISITKKESTKFYFSAKFDNFGEYFVTAQCTSISPVKKSKHTVLQTIGYSGSSDLGDWAPNSVVSCSFQAKVSFGNETIGQWSEPSFARVMLLEGKPSHGPSLSHLFVKYSSISNQELLSVVTIYFVNLPLVDRNGIITQYRWKCNHCWHKKRDVSYVSQNLSSEARSVYLDQAYFGSSFSMTACTNAGCSDSWTKFRFRRLKDDYGYRKLSIVRGSKNPSNITLELSEKNDDRIYNISLLACSHRISYECSSIEIFKLSRNTHNKWYLQIDDSLEWKFALISHGNEVDYQLKWISCLYNSPSIYEAEKKLQDQAPNTQKNVVCNLVKCEIHCRFKIPSCSDFADMYIYGLNIGYISDFGMTGRSIPLPLTDEVEFTLTDLSPGWKSYTADIYVSTRSNSSIMWFQITVITDFWSTQYVLLTVFGIVALFIIGICITYCRKKSIKDQYYKRKYPPKSKDVMVTKNNSITPICLLNTDAPKGDTRVIRHSSDTMDKDSSSSLEKGSTFSTSISDSGTPNNSSEEDLINPDQSNDSMAYTCRPTLCDGAYSLVAIPSIKKDHNTLVADTDSELIKRDQSHFSSTKITIPITNDTFFDISQNAHA